MRGRKSSRGAAVVLAGCVGLALVAPGLAVAQAAPTVQCAPTDLLCEPGSAGGSSAPEGGQSTPDTSTPETSTPTTTPSSDGSSGSGSLPIEVPALPGTSTEDDSASDSGPAVPGSTTDPTGSIPGSGTTDQQAAPALLVATPAAVETGADDLQDQLAGLLPGLPTVPGLPTLPGNLQFPADFEVPTAIPAGGFTNPQEACAFLAGSVTVPPADAAGLGTAFSQFCGALPTSFDPSGLGGLTDLLDQLEDLLGGLVPTLPGTTPGMVIGDGTIPSDPPAKAPAYSHGYWKKHYDVNCADVTFDEAQAVYAADRSDPFRLDGDDDGIACDRNSTVVNVDNYGGYPKGGVSTGDGTDTGASPAAVALAAMTLSFLALGGVALVRRFGRDA